MIARQKMSAANVNVIDISSSSSSSLEEDDVPRRRSERKRRLTDKAKEILRQREAKAAAAPKKAKVKRGRPAKAVNTKNKAKKDASVDTAAPAAADEDEEVCPICLDPPVLPVQLECSHQFCFTCAKGLAMENPEDGPGCCSLCRAPIPPGFFREVIQYRIKKSLKISPKNGPKGFVIKQKKRKSPGPNRPNVY